MRGCYESWDRGQMFEIHLKVKVVGKGELGWFEGRQRRRLVLHTEHGCLFDEILKTLKSDKCLLSTLITLMVFLGRGRAKLLQPDPILRKVFLH